MTLGTSSIRAYPDNLNPLEIFRPTLLSMFSIMDDYIERFHRPETSLQDLPYFYNERAILSILAGGVWRSNSQNMVFEEYGSSKVCGENTYRGRCDLWCLINDQTIYAEAKWRCPNLTTFDSQEAHRVIEILKSECEAARLNSENERANGSIQYACGLVFLAPYLSLKKQANWQESVKSFEDALHNAITDYTTKAECSILRATYTRTDLFEERKFYTNSKNVTESMPILEVMIESRR